MTSGRACEEYRADLALFSNLRQPEPAIESILGFENIIGISETLATSLIARLRSHY